MKKIILSLSLLCIIWSCKSPEQKGIQKTSPSITEEVEFNYSAESALEFLTSDDLRGRETLVKKNYATSF